MHLLLMCEIPPLLWDRSGDGDHKDMALAMRLEMLLPVVFR